LSRPAASPITSLAGAFVIRLIVDLDRPARELSRMPVQPLLEAAQGIPR
jgi:hypothetical protein